MPGTACVYMSPFAGVGGTQEYITVLACRMAKLARVAVMLPFDPAQVERFQPRLAEAGVTCISLPEDFCAPFARWRYDRRWCVGRELASKIVAFAGSDTLIAHANIDPISLGGLASRLGQRAGIVNTFHDFGVITKPSISRPLNSLVAALFLRRVRFITPSQIVKRELLQFVMATDPARVHPIPTGIDPLPSIATADWHTPARIYVMSRVSEAKAPDVFLEAVRKFIARGGRADFTWIGGGPLLEWAKAKVAELKLSDHVRFLGYLNDARPVLQGQDLFLLSSRWEGGCPPRGVLEAISQGFPCILPAITSIEEALGQGDAALFYRKGDADSLAQALRQAVESQAAMAVRAHAARDIFHARHLAEQEFRGTLALYKEDLAAT
ncbi:MAG TPA: glycosyltransferase [Rhizorhapis sp.]|nr:glycosyltransferase [Rhizorhapis sp.]